MQELKTKKQSHHTSHKKKRVMRSIVSLVLTFIMAICMTLALLLIGCKVGVFNTSVLMSQLNKTNYYASISGAIRENAEDIIRPSGLKEDILIGVIDDNTVYLDTKRVIEAQLKGYDYTLDTSEVKKAFEDNVKEYAAENDMYLTAQTKKGIEDLSNQITSEYSRLTQFEFAEEFVKYQSKFDKVFPYAAAFLIVIIIIIAVVLVKMQHWAHRGVRYIAYATLSAALMTGIIPIVLLVNKIYEKVSVSPRYMYELIVGVLKWDITVFVYMAAGAVIVFAGELLAIKILKQKAREK